MTLYAWLLLASLVGPLSFSFDKRISYYQKWRGLFTGIFINGILFITWDSFFAANGIWGFNSPYASETRWFHLPPEEWAFFIVIPYCSIFIYESLGYYWNRLPLQQSSRYITLGAFILTASLALFNTDKAYTFYNSAIAAVLLLIHLVWLKREWMGLFWIAYLVHLIPFFIVNGILTGIATDIPVVWYNNAENLGIRIGTIPVEDSIYAMTCLLIPITIMEWMERKR